MTAVTPLPKDAEERMAIVRNAATAINEIAAGDYFRNNYTALGQSLAWLSLTILEVAEGFEREWEREWRERRAIETAEANGEARVSAAP